VRFSSIFDQQWRERLGSKVESERRASIEAQLTADGAGETSSTPARSGGTS
jgi:hypothetical protein